MSAQCALARSFTRLRAHLRACVRAGTYCALKRATKTSALFCVDRSSWLVASPPQWREQTPALLYFPPSFSVSTAPRPRLQLALAALASSPSPSCHELHSRSINRPFRLVLGLRRNAFASCLIPPPTQTLSRACDESAADDSHHTTITHHRNRQTSLFGLHH